MSNRARKLDSDAARLTIYRFSTEPTTYRDLFSQYVQWHTGIDDFDYVSLNVPHSRSATYQAIAVSTNESAEIARKREVPNFISSAQYALGTDAKLILDSTTEAQEYYPDYHKDLYANVYLDCNGLLSKYRDLESAIMSAEPLKISIALNKARPHIKKGWANISYRTNALKHFASGLQEFITCMLDSQASLPTIDMYYKPPSGTSTDFGTFGIKIGFLEWLIQKRKFKGISRFINIRD